MRTQKIPETTLEPSVLCLGTALMGTQIPTDEALRLLDSFVEAGGTFIDTAAVYSDWVPGERNRVEKLLSRWMSERGWRDRIVLATKGAHPRLDSMSVPRMTRQEITSDLEASLVNLRTGMIDLYWLHRDDPATPVEQIVDLLNEFARAGKLRYFGCSNWTAERMAAANDYARRSGQHGFVASQPLWNLAYIPRERVVDPTHAEMNAAMLRYHVETQLACVPFASQANGYFQRAAAGTVAQMQGHHQRLYGDAENPRRAARARQLAAETGLSISEVVLAYLLSQPFPVFPILGCRNDAQLRDSLSAHDKRLTAGQIAFLVGERGI